MDKFGVAMPNPANVFAFCDCALPAPYNRDHLYEYDGTRGYGCKVHNEGTNYGFVDGHARWFKQTGDWTKTCQESIKFEYSGRD